jgi:hypothetical protein
MVASKVALTVHVMARSMAGERVVSKVVLLVPWRVAKMAGSMAALKAE